MILRHTTQFLALLVIVVGFLWYSDMKVSTAADIHATITTGFFVPQRPVNLAVTVDDLSVDLSWATPLSDGGSTIIDYVIEYKLTSSGVWSVFSDGVSINTFTSVTGLSNDNAYDFRVYAVNAIGQGAASSEVHATPGAPAQVLITGFTDLTLSDITASARITNEGAEAYEYQYTWCVTNSEINLCGGGNDVFYASAAKLIQSGENWDTNLTATLSAVGSYWFHLQVQFGSDSSYASQSFTASEEEGGGSSSSGGGGGRKNSIKASSCVGADANRDKIVNLVDFSILLMFFNTGEPFTNPCVDINRDAKVNVVDFSIMLTQWGKKPILYKPTP